MKDVILRDGGGIIVIMSLLCLIRSVLDSSMCVNIVVSVMEMRMDYGRDYNSYQTQSCVFIIKREDWLCSISMPGISTLDRF